MPGKFLFSEDISAAVFDPAHFDCFRFPKLINTELEVFLTFFSINLEGLRGKIQ